MSYTLRLGFGGLCLFTHDVQNGLMHVLLPRAAGHQPTLTHDAQATTQKPHAGNSRHRKLAGTLIDLTELTSTTVGVDAPPTGIANLEKWCTVPRKLVRDTHPGGDVATRVTFNRGRARVADCGEGGFWEFDGRKQLNIRVYWEIKVDDADNPLIIQRMPLNGSAGYQTIELFADGGRLDVWISNSPVKQLPPHLPPKTDWDSETTEAHFHEFYRLLKCSGPEPGFRGRPPFNASCYVQGEGTRGYDLTCIAARAPLG